MSLLTLADLPRPVVLGGTAYLVYELRLADIALLEAFAAARTPWPADGLPDREDPGWHERFNAAWDAAEAWPPCVDGDLYREAFATAEATAYYLWVVLHRGAPEMTVADAAVLLAGMMESDRFAAEWRELGRAAWGRHPLDELIKLTAADRASEPPEPGAWDRAVYEVMTATGCGFDEVMGWTLSRFAAARRRGEPKQYGTPVDGMSWDEIMAERNRRRAAFYGEAGEN